MWSERRPDLVVAPFLSPEVRRRLIEAGIGFLDGTGNLRVSLAEPGLFIEAMGADRNPNPRQRPARSLAGIKAGHLVRALCERITPWGVREAAAATGTNPGYVSRLLAFLDKEALITRDKKGRIARTDWQRLIPRWAEAAPLDQSLTKAGFWHQKKDSVGAWVTHRVTEHDPRTVVCVDFLVPTSISPGKGRRAARLRGHDPRLARKVAGLEGALVDRDRVTLGALTEEDQRSFDIKVAGPAALLVSKLIKIDDRCDTPRQNDKDALDVVRLLRGVATSDLAERMLHVANDERSSEVACRSIDLLRSLFCRRSAAGIQMAIRSTFGLMDPDELAVSCELLASSLLQAISH